jgi:hypothetical protein
MGKIDPEKKPDKLELFKAMADYLKHVTTLSTGSIVLITTFLEKLFAKPEWKIIVVVSIVGFMVSVLSSMIAYTILILYENPLNSEETPTWAAQLGTFGMFSTWIGFLIGILTLAIFALRNFIG